MYKLQSHHRAFPSQLVLGTLLCISPTALLVGCDESAVDTGAETENAPALAISLEAAIIEGDDHAVHAHITAGTPANTRSPMGDTPLHIAAAIGRTYATEILIGAGAELESKNSSGVTPLFNAAFFCHTDTLKILIDAGANTKATDQNNMTIGQIMEMPWDQIRPVYELVHNSIGLPFDENRIKSFRPQIAAMLR